MPLRTAGVSLVCKLVAGLALVATSPACAQGLGSPSAPPTLPLDSPCHRWQSDRTAQPAESVSPAPADGATRFGLGVRCALESLVTGGGVAFVRGIALGVRDAVVATGQGLMHPAAVATTIDAQFRDRGEALREASAQEWTQARRAMVADPQRFAGAAGRLLGVIALAATCAGLLAYLGRVLYLLGLQARYPHMRFDDWAVRFAGALFARARQHHVERMGAGRQGRSAAFQRARAALVARRHRQRGIGARRVNDAVRNGVADLNATIRNLSVRPRAALAFALRRAGEVAGRGVAAFSASLWSLVALGFVPVLVILNEPIANAAERLAARHRLADGIERWQALSARVSASVDAAEVQVALDGLAASFEAYRLRLLAPLGAVETRLERELAALNAMVAQWKGTGEPNAKAVDGVIDARMERSLDDYARSRMRLIEELLHEGCTQDLSGDCWTGFRVAAYEEETALLGDWAQRLDAATATPVRARIDRLRQCVTLEQHDYREGNHEALLMRARSGCP